MAIAGRNRDATNVYEIRRMVGRYACDENNWCFTTCAISDSSVRNRAQSEVEANARRGDGGREHPEAGALPGGPAARFALTADQLRRLREELLRLKVGSYHARRLQVVLLTVEGLAAPRGRGLRLGLSRFHVSRIRSRFRAGGLEALVARGRRGRPSSVSAEVVAQVLDMAALPPPSGMSPLEPADAGPGPRPEPLVGLPDPARPRRGALRWRPGRPLRAPPTGGRPCRGSQGPRRPGRLARNGRSRGRGRAIGGSGAASLSAERQGAPRRPFAPESPR